MDARFWMVAAAHHVVVVLAAVVLAWLWVRRGSRPVALVAGLAVFGAVAATSAWIASDALPDRPFGFSRLLAQVAFGEVPLLLGLCAVRLARRGHRRVAVACALVSVLVLLVYVQAYHVEPRQLFVRREAIEVAGLGAPLRVVHLSDIQAWHAGGRERHVLREAMRQAPDLIFLTGDYVQSRHTDSVERDVATLRRLFREEGLRAPLGVFAVWGNCDRANRDLFDGLPVRALENEVARVELPGGEALSIVGLEWRTSMAPRKGDLRRLFRQVKPGDHAIVLGHAPDFADEVAGTYDVDLMLAGHTHGGQVALPLLGPLVTLSRAAHRVASGGLSEVRGVPVNVSRGTGLERGSAPQIRFLCPPEMSVLDLAGVPKRASR